MPTQDHSDQISQSKRATDAIAETLIAEIRAEIIASDSPLPTERELCERFHSSRPTVREALAQMQMRGYAIAGAGKRPRAARPSLTDVLRGAGDHIRDILGDAESGAHLEQVRQYVETGAVREAATKAGNAHIAKIRLALERNFEAIGTDDFPATDIAFHRAIVSGIGNPIVLTLHDMFVSELLRQRPTLDDPTKHDRMAYEEHRRIYEAILASDPTVATRDMDVHLARSYRARLKRPHTLNKETRQ